MKIIYQLEKKQKVKKHFNKKYGGKLDFRRNFR